MNETRQSLARFVQTGFTRRSVVALGVIAGAYCAIGYRFSFLIEPSRGMDWLLAGIWTALTLAMIWRVDPRRDILLIGVGLVGGIVIEWWGTNTELWSYWTHERPPIWILPAWPAAAVAMDRLALLFDHAVPQLRRCARAYWVVVPAFVVWMTTFLWPSIAHPASWVVVGIMLGVTFIGARPARDLPWFVVGSLMGIFLEYWGTSRQCWTYYTREIPPPVAIVAHGFAAVAFSRGVQWLELGLTRVGLRALAGEQVEVATAAPVEDVGAQ